MGKFTHSIFGLGNPLLDISTKVEEDFLKKYHAEASLGTAILASKEQLPLYEDLVETYKDTVSYVAGGATQNSIRVAQWMMPEEDATVFTGCIGDDDNGAILTKRLENDNVVANYKVQKDVATGTCAVCVVKKERALIANISAAENFSLSFLKNDTRTVKYLAEANVVYSCAFVLTAYPDSMLYLAQYCTKNDKVFAMNLSAIFLIKFFTEKLLAVLPFADFIFANEEEAAALGETFKYDVHLFFF